MLSLIGIQSPEHSNSFMLKSNQTLLIFPITLRTQWIRLNDTNPTFRSHFGERFSDGLRSK